MSRYEWGPSPPTAKQRIAAALFGFVIGVAFASEHFGWRLFGDYDKQVGVAVMGVWIIVFAYFMPTARESCVMVQVVYLDPDQQASTQGDRWMLVEADTEGLFHGTGAGLRSSGEAVFYASSSRSDTSLTSAVEAAVDWASSHAIDVVQVQSTARV